MSNTVITENLETPDDNETEQQRIERFNAGGEPYNIKYDELEDLAMCILERYNETDMNCSSVDVDKLEQITREMFDIA